MSITINASEVNIYPNALETVEEYDEPTYEGCDCPDNDCGLNLCQTYQDVLDSLHAVGDFVFDHTDDTSVSAYGLSDAPENNNGAVQITFNNLKLTPYGDSLFQVNIALTLQQVSQLMLELEKSVDYHSFALGLKSS